MMAKSRLSIHAIPVHDPRAVLDYVRQLRPPLILIVNPDPGFISDCYKASPDSLFSLRNHALSEQKEDMYRDPAGTGDRHAREMVEWCDKLYADAANRNLPMPPLNQVILPGINEPLINEDSQIAANVTYNVHYLDGLTARGRRGSCLEFSVGWPRNAGANQPPQWQAYRPVYDACKRGNHVASIHEYWPKEGPSYWAGWLCYRCVRYIPSYWADVDFIFTEVGLDDAAAPGRAHAFWKDFFYSQPHMYVSQYVEYETNNRTYTNQEGVQINVIGYAIFTSDYGGNEWENADIKQITQLFLHMVATTNFPEPKPKGNTIYLPEVGNNPKPTPPVKPIHQPDDSIGWVVDSMSRIFGFDPDLAQAILNVESGGRVFADGRPVIRNEVHLLPRYTDDDAKVAEHFRWDSEKPWEDQVWRRNTDDNWEYIHTSQDKEYEVHNFIRDNFGAYAAYNILGMGAGQMMGFNHNVAEYDSAEQMFQAFSDPDWGGENQVLGMFAYFYKNDMIGDIQRQDLSEIARKYNGSGNVPYYVKRFKEELAKIKNQG